MTITLQAYGAQATGKTSLLRFIKRVVALSAIPYKMKLDTDRGMHSSAGLEEAILDVDGAQLSEALRNLVIIPNRVVPSQNGGFAEAIIDKKMLDLAVDPGGIIAATVLNSLRPALAGNHSSLTVVVHIGEPV